MHAILMIGFLFLKTGEKFATQEAAGPTVSAFTASVGEKLGVTFEARVLNDPTKAVEFVAAKKPAVGIVTPGFYLAYFKQLGLEPLLETRRQNVPAERYVLIVSKTATDDLKGKTITTTLTKEERYFSSVILQGKLGEEVRLKAVPDVEGAAFDLAEGAKNAPDAILMEEGTWKAMEKDEELGPKLKVAFTSGELPRDLVVLFRPNAEGLDAQKLKVALTGVDKQVLANIRVDAFVDVDQPRLDKAQALFNGK